MCSHSTATGAAPVHDQRKLVGHSLAREQRSQVFEAITFRRSVPSGFTLAHGIVIHISNRLGAEVGSIGPVTPDRPFPSAWDRCHRRLGASAPCNRRPRSSRNLLRCPLQAHLGGRLRSAQLGRDRLVRKVVHVSQDHYLAQPPGQAQQRLFQERPLVARRRRRLRVVLGPTVAHTRFVHPVRIQLVVAAPP